jgi:peroxiredoxin
MASVFIACNSNEITEENESVEQNEITGENESIEQNEITGIGVGNKAKDFTLKNLDGVDSRLRDYRGQKVVLNFWATWCPPCREEMPDLNEFYQDNLENVVVIGINIGESKKTVQEFMEKGGYTFPILLDEKQDTAKQYEIAFIPTSFFINETGIITDIHTGLLTKNDLRNKLLK